MNNKGLKLINPFILPFLFILCWQFFAIKIANPIVLPSVDSVLNLIIKPTDNLLSIGSLLRNTWVSLVRVGMGYSLAVLIGIPLGMLIGYSKFAESFLKPFLSLFRPIAPLAWVPLVLAWFGVTSVANVLNIQEGQLYTLLDNVKISMLFIIFIGGFFPILTNTIYGVKSVRNTLIDSAITLGATKKDIFFKILFPAAMPSILTGLRVGLGVAWMCLVSAEMLPGSIAGVGYLITHAYTLARTDIVIAGMISISLVGGFFEVMFNVIETKFFSWQKLDK
ncbi:ABC transporter permease [Proteinivorax tanatarense]|uniref:ABC transporter permease n=1 Tax=Proteinivorax tanatarense TaxID=1260629 RepID=A0AAU7VMZ0_9FIRM